MGRLAHLCAAAALALPLTAIATLNLEQPNCTSDPCVVTVTVPAAGCGAGITVTPDPVIFKVGASRNIAWTVSPADSPWTFTGNGIFINMPSTEFVEGKVSGDKKQYRIKNKNSKRGTYKYDINLTALDGKMTCSLDPTIMNY